MEGWKGDKKNRNTVGNATSDRQFNGTIDPGEQMPARSWWLEHPTRESFNRAVQEQDDRFRLNRRGR